MGATRVGGLTAGYKPVGNVGPAVQVECVFFGPLREAVGRKALSREATGTVGGLLAALEAEHPSLEGRLLDGEAVASDVTVMVNGTHLQQLDGLDTQLDADDVVRLAPPIHGGARPPPWR